MPPDVLSKFTPALSSTSDAPTADNQIEVKTPPVSAEGTDLPKAPAVVTPPPEGEAKPEAKVEPVVEGEVKPEGEAKPEKKKEGIAQRMSELTADKKAALEKAATEEQARKDADARADKLAKDLATALEAIGKVLPPEPEDVRPTRAQFDDPDKYDTALVAWSERMGAKKATADAEAKFLEQKKTDDAKAAEDVAKAESERVGKLWSERTTEFTKETPDFEEVIKNPEVMITPIMGQAIMYSEMGPKLAYHLGKNPDVAKKIGDLAPPLQLIEMGKLEAKLSQPPKTTTTPDPITPIKPAGKTAVKSPNEETMDEYAARRRQELRTAKS